MGIGEIRSKVVVEMKYDVSDARASLKHLQGDEKKTGELRIQLAEMENKRIETSIKNYGRLSTGLQMANMAGIDLGKSIRDLTGIPVGGAGSALGFMLGGPMGAAIGTVGEMLGGKLADAFMTSTRMARLADEQYVRLTESIKAENKELEESAAAYAKVAQARRDADPGIGGMARALDENTGKWQKARDAIVSYSMALSDVQGDRRAVLSGPFKDGPGAFISRQEIELQRSLRDAKTTAEGTTSPFGAVAADAKIKADRLKDSLADLKAAKEAGALSSQQYADGLKALGIEAKEADKALTDMFRARFHATKYLDTEAKAFERYAAALKLAQDEADTGPTSALRGKGQQATADGAADDFSTVQLGGGMENFLKQYREGLAEDEFNRAADGKTLLEQTIGPIDQFDAYGAAFQGMTDVMVGAYEAIINGSEGSAAALKKIAASAMMTVGKGMLVEGIKHQALAIGDLASENYKGFVMHQTAAAKNFAGAAVVGGIAAALGGTGSVGGGAGRSAASAPTTYRSSNNSYAGGSNVTIVYGDQFADDSPRNRQRTAQKLVGRALGTSGVDYS